MNAHRLLKKALAWALVLLFLPVNGFAGKVHSAAGSTSASFLKLVPNPRAWGMGQAHAGVADDVYASVWNPAGLVQVKQGELALMHAPWTENISQGFLGYARPLSGGAGLAFSAQGLFTPSDLERRSGQGEDIPTSPLTASEGEFGANDLALALSYAKPLSHHFNGGVTFKIIRQSIDDQKAMGYAADLGLLWKAEDRPVTLGAVIQNLGTPIKFNNKAYKLPLDLRLGAAWRPRQKLLVAADLSQPIDNYLFTSLGAEYRVAPVLALRTGYRMRLNGNELDAQSGLGAGLGIYIKPFQIDYAFSPMGDLGQMHRVGLLVRWGSQEMRADAGRPMPAAALPLLPLKTESRPLRMSGQKTLQEITAVAQEGPDIRRIKFQSKKYVGAMALQERRDAASGFEGYKQYALVEGGWNGSVNADVEFRIPRAWFEEKQLSADQAGLYVKEGGTWVKQPTRLVSQDGEYFEFESRLNAPGLAWALGAEVK